MINQNSNTNGSLNENNSRPTQDPNKNQLPTLPADPIVRKNGW